MNKLPFDQALNTLNNVADRFFIYLPFIIIGLLVFLVFILLARIVRRVICETGQRTRLDETLASILSSMAAGLTAIIGFFVAMVIIFPTFSPGNLVAGLGITSVALGFALKDILQNFFAGLLILWRKPFRIGDEIQTDKYEGTVTEINVRSTHIKTYEGTLLVIPNGSIYTNPVLVNTAYNSRRSHLKVSVSYTDDLARARDLIHRVLRDTQGVLADPAPWVYVSELAPSSVYFEVYYWTSPDQATVLQVRDRVVAGIKQTLTQAGIELPSPYQVVLLHDMTQSGQTPANTQES